MASDLDARHAVIEGVLAHLSRYPNAADTADGIRAWWMEPQMVVDPAEMEAALDELVREGQLERALSSGGTTVYRRARGTT